VLLKPRSQWPDPKLPQDELIKQMQAALDDVPDMRAVLTLFEGVATGAADGAPAGSCPGSSAGSVTGQCQSPHSSETRSSIQAWQGGWPGPQKIWPDQTVTCALWPW